LVKIRRQNLRKVLTKPSARPIAIAPKILKLSSVPGIPAMMVTIIVAVRNFYLHPKAVSLNVSGYKQHKAKIQIFSTLG